MRLFEGPADFQQGSCSGPWCRQRRSPEPNQPRLPLPGRLVLTDCSAVAPHAAGHLNHRLLSLPHLVPSQLLPKGQVSKVAATEFVELRVQDLLEQAQHRTSSLHSPARDVSLKAMDPTPRESSALGAAPLQTHQHDWTCESLGLGWGQFPLAISPGGLGRNRGETPERLGARLAWATTVSSRADLLESQTGSVHTWQTVARLKLPAVEGSLEILLGHSDWEWPPRATQPTTSITPQTESRVEGCASKDSCGISQAQPSCSRCLEMACAGIFSLGASGLRE